MIKQGDYLMHIEKTASNFDTYRRDMILYENARSAFTEVLELVHLKEYEIVLLPAYIGWSSHEGSGVFDPIKKLGLKYDFYKINSELNIDVDDLANKLKFKNIRVLVVIHYFGYIDKNYEDVVRIAKENNVIVIEDEAHAMYTDLIGGISGRKGDFSLFSLHKMLPVKTGGALVINQNARIRFSEYNTKLSYQCMDTFFSYDLKAISEKRIRNTKNFLKYIDEAAGYIKPLRLSLEQGEIPQTFPVMVGNGQRDYLYFKLNELGYGVVSLYHELIKEISEEEYKDSYKLSKNILNLPVHQDVEEEEIFNLVTALKECIRRRR